MTDKEKLIDLLCKAHSKAVDEILSDDITYAQQLEIEADLLIANGVKIPVLCKDCTSYNTKGCAAGFGWCEAWDQGRMDNNYCHCGEGKNND